MLLFHRALQLWPRPTRFFVLALALLQFVAPTWHVCEMGGHVMAHGATKSHHGALKLAQVQTQSGATETQQPLICFCQAHEKPAPDPNAPQLESGSHPSHATCLALLLQTMPATALAPPAIFEIRTATLSSFIARHETAPQTAILRRFRGRAPPMFL